MFGGKGKDLMDQVADVLSGMTEEEKADKARRLKALMDNELNKRKLTAHKKPKKD